MAKVPLPDADEIAAAGHVDWLDASHARDFIPLVWLIGKVQSGKTSIIRAITGNTTAEIGLGFKAATRTAKIYDYPAAAPMLRFLDTRGLGEAAYDPSEDLALAEAQAHLMLITVRAMDLALQPILDIVTTVRRRHPAWPLVVAQTCLHEGYDRGQGHLLPYPFSLTEPDAANALAIPTDLKRCLGHQRALFRGLPGAAPVLFVPIDFTQPADALPPETYGLDTLTDALIRAAPEAMRAVLETLPSVALDSRRQQAEPLIMGHALAAAGSDLVPVAGAVAVSAVQARLLQRIGQIYCIAWDRRVLAEFSAALGAGVAARTAIGFGFRQLAKLVPGYGQTVAAASSAATSFAVTLALGKAATHFMTRRQRGLSSEGTAAAYEAALREAVQLASSPAFARSRRKGEV